MGAPVSASEEVGETQILAALLGIAEMVGDLADIRELLDALVRIAPSLVRVDRCAVLAYDEGSREFRVSVYFGPSGEASPFKGLAIPASDMPRLSQRLLTLHLPALVKPESRDAALPAAVVRRVGLKSALLVPLVCRGRVLGVLWLDHSAQSHYFTSKEVNVIQGVATLLAVAMDGSARAASLVLERRRFEAIACSLADGVIIMDRELRILELDTSAENLLGWQSSEVRGRRVHEVFAITEAQAEVAWTRGTAAPSPAAKSLRLRTRLGTLVSCAVLAVPIRGDAGETVQVLFVLRAASPEPRPQAASVGLTAGSHGST